MTDNKLIADFLGLWWHENGTISGYPSVLNMRMGVDTFDDLKFHISWDWLMPVVEKIEREGYEVEISSQMEGREDDRNLVWHQDTYIGDGVNIFAKGYGDSKIKSVYMAVLDFIKWYNKTLN